MKKIICLILILIGLQSTLTAQLIDKSVATIKFTKTEAITQKQFMKMLEPIEAQRPVTLDEKKQLLDQLIDDKLLIQAAQKDGITVSDGELKQMLQNVKMVTEMQLGVNLSDDEYKKIVAMQEEKTGLSWEKLLEEVEKEAVKQKYIQLKLGPRLKEVKKPSEDTIEEYYAENRTSFVSAEMIKVKQIIIVTQGMPANITTRYKAKIDDIYNQITNKGASFDDFFEIYIEGQAEKVGGLDINFWQRDDEKKKAIYGKDFFNNIFKMKKGALSTVIKSNVGYHIIQILDKIPFQMLELDDKIPPTNTQTVKEKIEQVLTQTQTQDLLKQVEKEVVTELKKTAEIKIFEKNLEW